MNKDSFRILAQYNIWATQRLCESLKSVSDDDFNKDVGLYFKSIVGTLNHLLLGEHYLWYSRFKQGISPAIALNTMIQTKKTALLDELQEKSKNWIEFLEQLDEKTLNADLTYKRVSGQELTLPYAATLMHVFNHGTHHRGQITAAMTGLGYACPELDLVYMLAEQSQA
ncbi:DinB family protein [Acinetobacter guillouiae]|uniref:DinB family protein n=1 Tax=Acinetobacter guillouiae TaxID=106649 RepID=UPI0026E4855B|nr:DinB family protein [Acinetobacter guillouiae]MDO6643151.1 DinB family protein [Acinetobacter guillouiae]